MAAIILGCLSLNFAIISMYFLGRSSVKEEVERLRDTNDKLRLNLREAYEKLGRAETEALKMEAKNNKLKAGSLKDDVRQVKVRG